MALYSHNTKCAHPTCDGRATIKSLCRKHYMRLRRHGDTDIVVSAGRPVHGHKDDEPISKGHEHDAGERTDGGA